jgi:predicted signal transduction protein with EAL and GGDEF domain
MSLLNKVVRFFAVPDDPELVRAQARALSRQVPLLYAMLLANTLILAGTHLDVAPPLLSAYIPSALSLLGIARLLYWWRGRHRVMDAISARRMLTSMIWVAAGLAIGFTAWSMALFPYGDAYRQSHVAFYMAITAIGCMFCLMHVRGAALMVGACVLIPFAIFLCHVGPQHTWRPSRSTWC